MVIVIANDVESNPGPTLDRCFHYVRNYLNDKDYKSSVLKDHIDKLLALQSDDFLIPEDYLTDDNITLWADVRDKAYKDGFDEDFCQKVFSIWKHWEDRAFELEHPNVPLPSRSIQKRTNHKKAIDPVNFSIELFDEHQNHCGEFQYQLNQNNEFICIDEHCNKGKKPMKNRESLKDHARRYHNIEINLQKKTGSKTEPYKCACGKIFMKKQTLKQHEQKCKELKRVRTASAPVWPSHGTFGNDAAQPQVQPTDTLFAGNLANSSQVDNGSPAASTTLVSSSINTYPHIPAIPTTFDKQWSNLNFTISIPTDKESEMPTIQPPIKDDYGRAGATSTLVPFISNNHEVQGNQTAFDIVNEMGYQEEVPNISATSHIAPFTQPSLMDEDFSNFFGTDKLFNT